MAATSNNIYDIYNWVSKVIDSCKTPEHTTGARKLVELFVAQSDDNTLYWDLYYKVNNKKIELLGNEQSR